MKLQIELKDPKGALTTFVIWSENDGSTPHGTIGFKIIDSNGETSKHKYIDLDSEIPDLEKVTGFCIKTDVPILYNIMSFIPF